MKIINLYYQIQYKKLRLRPGVILSGEQPPADRCAGTKIREKCDWLQFV